MKRVSKIASFTLVLILIVGTFACKKTESTTSTAATSTTATTATVVPAPQPAPVMETTATTAIATSAPAAGVIASTEGEREGARVEITELKRASGGNVNLKFVIVNNSAKEFSMAAGYLGDSNLSTDYYRGVSGIHLIDPVNKKKYFVVLDAEKKCVCSKDVADVQAGGRVSLWAKFPAPPPEVQKVTIEIPHFQPIDDVPIAQ
jgi:hypothetical protein